MCQCVRLARNTKSLVWSLKESDPPCSSRRTRAEGSSINKTTTDKNEKQHEGKHAALLYKVQSSVTVW